MRASSAFNDLTNNSGRNAWCIGRAEIDLEKMRLMAPSEEPLITAAHLTGRDIAFVADPFRIVVNNATYVFAEAWSRSEQRGQIALFQLNSFDQVVESDIVLAERFHLSYPCVFEHGGFYYMLPEAWECGHLVLYRARKFPWEWQRFKVLLELDYADPQIFFHDNLYYIFLNNDPLTNECASVFWSESLVGTWHPHPHNPFFSSDALQGRSAGSLIRHHERILRFSQDCRKEYGQGVFASEIVELTPSSIRAKPVGQIEMLRPNWAQNGFHHLDIYMEKGVQYALFDGYSANPGSQQIQAERPR
jgi:hypothetical protein